MDYHVNLYLEVQVKVMNVVADSPEEAAKKARREVKIAGTLNHPDPGQPWESLACEAVVYMRPTGDEADDPDFTRSVWV